MQAVEIEKLGTPKSCKRCGFGQVRISHGDELYPEIQYTVKCTQCGNNEYVLKSEYSIAKTIDFKYASQFEYAKTRAWTKGIKKYRGKENKAFQGDPLFSIKKNIINLANLLDVLKEQHWYDRELQTFEDELKTIYDKISVREDEIKEAELIVEEGLKAQNNILRSTNEGRNVDNFVQSLPDNLDATIPIISRSKENNTQ